MIIGISGKKGSGKDLVGSIIQYLTVNEKKFKGESPEDIFSKLSIFKDRPMKEWSKQELFTNPVFLENVKKSSLFEVKKFADKIKEIVSDMLNVDKSLLENREFKNKPLSKIWWYYKVYEDGKYRLIPYREDITLRPNYTLIKTTPRILMQNIGTEGMRNNVHPNFWVNYLMSDYKPSIFSDRILENSYPNWLITDLRFPNELYSLENKGFTIRIERNIGKMIYPSENWGSNVVNIQKGIIMNEDRLEYTIASSCGKDLNVYKHEVLFENEEENHISEAALDTYDFSYRIDNNGSIDELFDKVLEIMLKEQDKQL